MIAIESNIPMPPRVRYRTAQCATPKYPWMSLKVGQSFVFPARSSLIHTQRLASSSVCYRHTICARRYEARTMPDEATGEPIVRIWRVA